MKLQVPENLRKYMKDNESQTQTPKIKRRKKRSKPKKKDTSQKCALLYALSVVALK